MKRIGAVALVGAILSACGGPGSASYPVLATPGKAAPSGAATAAAVEDASSIDLAMYLKIARLYCFLHLNQAELDYAGSRWLTEGGMVLPKTAGWTFGYYHEPDMGTGEKAFAVLHVNQAHALTVGNPHDVGHRGTTPLWLGGMASPRDAIRQALIQGLPRGDRFGVEYMSSDENSAQISLVSSFEKDKQLGQRRL